MDEPRFYIVRWAGRQIMGINADFSKFHLIDREKTSEVYVEGQEMTACGRPAFWSTFINGCDLGWSVDEKDIEYLLDHPDAITCNKCQKSPLVEEAKEFAKGLTNA